ncbi:hypothetical protein MGSAQ_002454 [marine sediment metagenome]|uniref:Uncharacterized protein n=1 Tax=marine sediment metagenome TaxID=412755 RepID=A0A1B6NRF8_9ZZZZ
MHQILLVAADILFDDAIAIFIRVKYPGGGDHIVHK